MKALIIDNSSEKRKFYKKAFTSHHPALKVVEAEGGAKGLEIYQEMRPFDYILLSHFVGNVSSIDILKNIRKVNTVTPIIMVSPEPKPSFLVEALKFGATEYLIEPFDIDTLLTIIDQALDSAYHCV